ncbi:FAD-dependent oxidoreductase, partial [Klebsiella pneumoniae]
NIEDLGLEALGVELDRGFIKTDAACRTNVFGLYAIGDVAGPPCLAHKASHEGVICIETLAGVEGTHPLDRDYVPGCTYSRPQVASLGLTESTSLARG